MKTVFFGSSKFVLPVINVLNKKFNLELVLTTEKNETEPVISFCDLNKIPYLSIKNKNELKSAISHQPSAISFELGVVADFGVIIPKEILSLFPKGILNIHPSLLPKYRGPTPVQTAILNGDKTTGVTIIKLDEHMDHGPIVLQETERISPQDSTQTLLKILFQKGANMLEEIIEPYIKDEIKLKDQKHEDATFTKILKRDDGYIDISDNIEPNKLELMIRAYFPWPGVWTRLCLGYGGEAKIIKFLPGNKIQVEGKKEMSYKDFINGYPKANSVLIKLLEHYA